MSLAALCVPPSPPLLASAIARQRSARHPCRRSASAIRSAALRAPPSPSLSPSVIHSAALCAPPSQQSLGSALRAALAAAPSSSNCFEALCAQPSSDAALGVGHELGSALRATLAAALGVGHRSAALYKPPSPPRSASAIRLQRSARRPRRRSASNIRSAAPRGAALAAALGSSSRLAALWAPPSPPLSASVIRSAALCTPPPLAAALGVGHQLGCALRAALAAALCVGHS